MYLSERNEHTYQYIDFQKRYAVREIISNNVEQDYRVRIIIKIKFIVKIDN